MKAFLKFVCLLLAAVAISVPMLLRQSAAGNETEDSLPTSEINPEGDRITRFLVLGCDRAAKLTDSIFVVALNETAKRASIVQIPRDTYANYTDRDYKKLNGAMNTLGEKGVKDLLSEALGVRLDYFVTLDLSCLQQVVNAIGGVDVDIPQDMVYSDPAQGLEIHLSKGQNHLDGKGVEQLVRYRSGYANADLGRLDAQKLFLKAFAKKCKSISASGLMQVTCLALTKVQTDIGLPEAIRVVSVLRECDTDDLPMATLAGEAVQGVSGAWYYCVNRAGGCRMVNEYLFPKSDLSEFDFDPRSLFDRSDNEDFHKIYTAPDRASAA